MPQRKIVRWFENPISGGAAVQFLRGLQYLGLRLKEQLWVAQEVRRRDQHLMTPDTLDHFNSEIAAMQRHLSV